MATRLRRRDGARVKRSVGLAAAAVAFAVPWLVDVPDLAEPGERMLGVFLAAIVLWVTEAVTLLSTAVLIILAEVLLVSDEAIVDLPDGYEAAPVADFFATLSHPVIMLFLGGFFLAEGAARTGLDRNLAGILLRPFGTSPRSILAGLMLATAAFSMFVSNTATTATLMAVILPVIATLPAEDRLRKGLALAIPVAANVGGLGTPVGSPPNAIAVGSLAEAGVSVSFVRWMALAVPLMIVVLALAWLVITRLYPATVERLELDITPEWDHSRRARVFYLVFAATVLLWLSEPLHGVGSSVVGFGAVVALLVTGVFGSRDLATMPWHVLWLVAGGIALGLGVAATGLDVWLVERVGWESVPAGLLALVLGLVALALSTVISNSAAANLLVPLALTLALSPAVDLEPLTAGFLIAVGASLAMALPVSTPPNAIAYSTGAVGTGDMARVGLIVGTVGLVLFVFVAPLLWEAMGVSP